MKKAYQVESWFYLTDINGTEHLIEYKVAYHPSMFEKENNCYTESYCTVYKLSHNDKFVGLGSIDNLAIINEFGLEFDILDEILADIEMNNKAEIIDEQHF